MTTAPKTLKDAVQVIRALNIDYLWVDALCIDQNSPDDWLVESAKMGDIYLQGQLNISAVAAKNGGHGLFYESDTSDGVVLSLQHRESTTHVLISEWPKNSWNTQIEGSRLSERGLVLQERLLSPRILHFGKGEIFWECNTVQTGETLPKLMHQEDSLKSTFLDSFLHPEVSGESALRSSREGAYRKWVDLLAEYGNRNLTRASDKIVAISGLASQIAKHLEIPMTSFVAGLWKESLQYSLLWSVDGIRSFPERAPSWSWARWDGRINVLGTGTLYEQARFHYHTRIITVDAEQIKDPSGSPSAVSLRLSGPLSLLHLTDTRKQSTNDDEFRPLETTASSLSIEAWRLQFDDSQIVISTNMPLYALLMVSSENDDNENDEDEAEDEYISNPLCFGLVLQPTNAKRGQFERIGAFTLLPVTSVHAFLMHGKDPSKIPDDLYINFYPDEGFEIELV